MAAAGGGGVGCCFYTRGYLQVTKIIGEVKRTARRLFCTYTEGYLQWPEMTEDWLGEVAAEGIEARL